LKLKVSVLEEKISAPKPIPKLDFGFGSRIPIPKPGFGRTLSHCAGLFKIKRRSSV
jgi:hypothetical protein